MLTNCEHAMAKSQQILLMNQMEMKNYQEIHSKIEEGILDSQKKISILKNELQKAKVVRKNKQEYDVWAKIIMKHPDRRETLKGLNQLEQEIKKLQQVRESLNRKYEKRSKQFQVLITSANELQKMFQEEENNIAENIQDPFLCPISPSNGPTSPFYSIPPSYQPMSPGSDLASQSFNSKSPNNTSSSSSNHYSKSWTSPSASPNPVSCDEPMQPLN